MCTSRHSIQNNQIIQQQRDQAQLTHNALVAQQEALMRAGNPGSLGLSSPFANQAQLLFDPRHAHLARGYQLNNHQPK